MARRVSLTERLRAEIDELFASDRGGKRLKVRALCGGRYSAATNPCLSSCGFN